MKSPDTVDLSQLLGNVLTNGHSDFLRQLLAQALHAVMHNEVQALCGADFAQRTDERTNSRNGYRERTLETRMGTVELKIPKLRKGSYLPNFLEPRRRWEKAFVQVVAEAYLQGVSTRRVESLIEAMGAKPMSASEVSRMAQSLDEQVQAFKTRPLNGPFPYVWFDALWTKVRRGRVVVDMAVLVAMGVDQQGQRRILGVEVADGEMKDAWRSFFEDLVERGLGGIRLIISDAHAGLAAARREVFNAVPWQRCRVHFMRNVLCRVSKNAKDFVAAALKQIYAQPTHDLALEALAKTVELLESKHEAAAKVLEEGGLDTLTYMSFPTQHSRQLHSTNVLERVNKELRRRTDVVGIFPNPASALRLITMILVEQDDEWTISRRYFSLESMALLDQPQQEVKALTEAA